MTRNPARTRPATAGMALLFTMAFVSTGRLAAR